MRIDTHIPGDPADLRAVAGWLRSSLSEGIAEATTRTYRARGTSASGWVGPTASAFTERMSTAGAGGDLLAADVARLGGSLDAFADAVHTAKAGMRRARQIAGDAGLTIGERYIHLPPGTEDPVKRAAWRYAEEEARRARQIVHAAEKVGREVWRDIVRKKYLRAAEFVNGTAKEILERQASALEKRASRIAKLGRSAVRSHLGRGLFRSASAAAEEAAEHAGTARRIGRKLPVVGIGLTAIDAAIDIHDGTPPAKAVSQATAGVVVGNVVADATIGLVSSVATPFVGVPVGLAAGTLAGELASVGAGKLYDLEQDLADKVVPDVVKEHTPKPVKSLYHKLFG